MYSYKVGTSFKIGFFKKHLNFCYDKHSGIIYSSDLKTLEELGLSKQQIAEAYLSGHEGQEISNLKKTVEELVEKQTENQKTIEELVKKNEKIVLFEDALKELVEYHKDLEVQVDEKETQSEEALKILKNSISILNKKIKDSNESIENVNIRTEAIIELLSEQAMNSKQTLNLLSPGITVEKIWNSMRNKNDAAVLSIMYMMKKFLEDKGTRF